MPIDRASKREPVPVLRMVRMVLLAMGGLGGGEGAAPAPAQPRCRYDLSARGRLSECTSTHCVALPGIARPQGSSWVEGDLSAAAFSGSRASLVLTANSTGLPPLTVLVRRVHSGAALPDVVAQGTLAGKAALDLPINISSWPVAQHTIAVAPDEDSLQHGWCGELRRFLRKVEPEQKATSAAVVHLRIGQPMLFLDNFYVASRVHTARTLVPAIQQRIVNDSFCASKPHPWMQMDRGPTQVCASCGIELGVVVNYGTDVPPLDDPESERYDCSGILNATAKDGSRVWTCWSRRTDIDIAGASTGTADDRSRMRATFDQPAGRSAWPPPPLVHWPIASTHVRHYEADDGPIDLTQVSVYYTYGSNSGHAPDVINNVSFPSLSGTPIWQRVHAGVKQTLVLPVDGIRGRPLLHCGTPPSQLQDPNVTCRDPGYCQCAGPNITDIGCSNDNFGGTWLLPTTSDLLQNGSADARPVTFVYAQARRISAFAPQDTAYDNLAGLRRVLVTWRTTDGLTWEQSWWGGAPPTAGHAAQDGSLLPRDPYPVAEHYGAMNFCAEHGQDVRSGCRAAAAENGVNSNSYAPILSWLMPYDARRQQFWIDFTFSTDGLHFHRVRL